MSLEGFTIEGHLDVVAADGAPDSGVKLLFASGAPLGTSGPTDSAGIGSLFLDVAAGHKYSKTASTSSASDWILEGKLSSGYSLPANALPAGSDTFESALGKLDANQQDLVTLSGEANGAVDHGTFTGDVIPDNSTTHAALQALESEIESSHENNSEDDVTTATVLDSELVDAFNRCEWIVTNYFVDDRARSNSYKVSASHNGHVGADATTVDWTISAKQKHGANFNADTTVVLSGVAGAQIMSLTLTSSETNGIDVRTRKIGCTIAQG
jgi:hypothetical protein